MDDRFDPMTGKPRFSSLRAPSAGTTDVVRTPRRARTAPPPEDQSSPAIGTAPLPSIRSLKDDGTTSLTTFLEEPLPSNPPDAGTSTPPEPVEEAVPAMARAVDTLVAPEPPGAAAEVVRPRGDQHVIEVRAERDEPRVSARGSLRASRPLAVSRVPLAIGVGVGVVAILIAVVWMIGGGDEDGAEVAGAGSGAEAEGETEAEAENGRESGTGTGTGTGTGSAEGTTETEVPRTTADAIAVLPAPTPEVLGENTWVRRLRAAELRTAARRHYSQGDWRLAQQTFEESLAWDATSVDAMQNVSRAHQRLGEMELALAWARRALITAPNEARTHELIGDQLLMLGRDREAEAAYRAGIAARPRDVRLRSRLRRLREQ